MRGRNYIGQDSQTNRAVLIRVNNAEQLARSQGALASFAQAVAPATVEKRVLDAVRDKVDTYLKGQSIDATVELVEQDKFRAADGTSHIARDMGIALMAVGGVALLWRVATWRKK
jgi:hypothetical protein